MDSPITRAEHVEFEKRMQEEHNRQNHRIDELERAFEQNNKLLVTVERIAISIEQMQKELLNQGERLTEIESRDGEMWRKVVGYIATAVAGVFVGFVFKQIGM